MQEPPKAYKDQDFLNSPAARHIRILCEYEEPRQRFLRHGVKHTLVFFGSARIRPPDEAAALVAAARKNAADKPGDTAAAQALDRAIAVSRLAPYYEACRELSRRHALRGAREEHPQHGCRERSGQQPDGADSGREHT